MESFAIEKYPSLAIIASSAIGAHILFKRYEFEDPLPALLLLGAVPGSLTRLLVPHFSSVLTATLVTFTVYLTSLLLSVGIYRASPIHPLANYPGPVLCKLSKLWMVYITWTGKRHHYIRDLHRKYGDIVRTGPNEVYIRDPTGISPLMGKNGWTKSSHWTARTLNAPAQPVIAIRDPEEHASRRKIWVKGFSTAAVKGYEPVLSKHVDRLVEYLTSQNGAVDLAQCMGHFGFDFMADVALGVDTDMVRMGDKSGIWKVLDGNLKSATLFGNVPWFAGIAKNIPGVGTKIKAYQSFVATHASNRQKQGSQLRDIFHYLADEEGSEKQPIPFSQVVSDGSLAVSPGAHSTSATLSSFFYYLLANPNAYARLQAEIDEVFPPSETPNLNHMKDIPYLDACINETLRLSPAVLTGSPRSAYQPDSSEGKMIGPYYIPEGTIASINTYALQRDPRNFSPYPDGFWPERWLISHGLESAPAEFVHNSSAFIPFSYGPASCVGKSLAILELRSTAIHIVHRVQMEFAKGYKKTWESDLQDFFAPTKGKLPVLCTARVGA